MLDYRTALITGASAGIGTAYAEALAARHLDLVLVARSAARLNELAARLERDYAVKATVIAADLSAPGAGIALGHEVAQRGIEVDLLINNAGFGTAGEFHLQDAGRERQEILLNVAAVVDLCHAFLPGMVLRKRGGILNVASSAAFQPTPYMTVYGATKAFVLSFSEGLRGEYRGMGIRVCALCPGPVKTEFFAATGHEDKMMSTIPKGIMLTAERVVADSLAALAADKGVCVPGLTMKAMAFVNNLAPRDLLVSASARVMKKLK